MQFQFTHPGRGATSLISGRVCATTPRFNSRTPGGVRLIFVLIEGDILMFQFTHPGRGATATTAPHLQGAWFQFTHPGRGATPMCRSSSRGTMSFNSRTPGGVRLISKKGSNAITRFQFTHPGRGATSAVHSPRSTSMFQFTHPGRGATVAISGVADMERFQFTHPGRGATAFS